MAVRAYLPRIAFGAAAVCVVLYLLMCLYFFLHQRSFLFPVPLGALRPSNPLLRVVEIDAGARPVFVSYLPAATGLPTLVFYHGNGEQLADSESLALALGDLEFGFFSVEYPGYGLARGQPTSEHSIVDASVVALRYLQKTLKVSNSSIVLFGQSLGTGVAAQMAARGYGAKLILASPYTSIPEVGARLLPFIPVELLARDRFDTRTLAPRVKIPVLIIHGNRDELIPVSMAQSLAQLFPHSRLLVIPEARHNDILEVDRTSTLRAIVDFSKLETVH